MDQQGATSQVVTGATRPAKPIHLHYEGGKPAFWRYALPHVLVRTLWRNRALLHQLSKSRFSAGHREDILGMAWLVLEPLALLGVYSIVFLVILKFKFASRTGAEFGPLGNTLSLYAGIVTYQMFASALNASASVIRTAQGYVKQMVFPTEVLPASVVGGLIVPAAIGYAIVLAAAAIGGLPVGPIALALPAVLAPMFLLVLGLGWLLGALAVFIPDVRTLTGIVTRFGFFLTPVVYPLSIVKDADARALLMLNPLTWVVEGVRSVLLRAQAPMWLHLGLLAVGSVVLCQLAFAFFIRSKRWFADVV